MSVKFLKELIATNNIPDDAILRVTDPEEDGMVDATGVVYGQGKDGQYTIEFYSDEP
jgi:hypothetical protein